ncbi:hypothetical protein [Candidatus Thiothrix anitrata]|jgi:hypothetical protein|uniref:Uncharacterized protein n=1 Tax=Candidatus Thiothrix anitrata TaxID=2823902 RepID=A0ABX7X7P9_9GAMM|nr:hypothetical protein [Candidatus Thiothrix anitrata]QTR51153.1 hypothetical protein J8380_06265 [Candidatus Thiothrix anitrata]
MVESGIVSGLVFQPPNNQLLQLPAPSNAQVMKFEAMMTQSDKAQIIENSTLLQTSNSDTGNSTDLKNVLLDKIAKMDSAYNRVVSGSQEVPKFHEFLTANMDKSSQGVNQVRSYPEVPANSVEDRSTKFERLIERSQAYTSASLEYQAMLANSLSRSKLFSANFQALTSAVQKLAEGFKTLFRT